MRLKHNYDEVTALTNNHRVFWQVFIGDKVELVMAARAVLRQRQEALAPDEKLDPITKRLKAVLLIFERVEEPDVPG